MVHIVSFRMTDDELRERLNIKDGEILGCSPSIYSSVDEQDGSLEWIVEATKEREGN